MLVLIGLGAVHLSGSGTAVPVDPVPAVSAPGPGAADGSEGGAEDGSESARGGGAAPADDGPGPADADSAQGGDPAAASESSGGASDPPAEDPSAAPRGADEAPSEVVVHVSGAVAEQGVVRLPGGSRVDDALEAAGGPAPEADLTAVNLARPLTDGEQIHVPVPGEEPLPSPSSPPSPEAGGADGEQSGGEAAADGAGGGPIDLNTASAAELEELPGVGPAIAQRIIEHRERNGPFAAVDGLLEVSGIGPATFEKLRDRATV